MRATIDAAGRVVIPKAIRARLGLRGGEELEVDGWDDHIELRRVEGDVRLVETEHGIRTIEAPGLPGGYSVAEVREILERTRR